MKNPRVSIIIPVYNREEKIKECLESVLNQTYENYEVIVVDNNSTDHSGEVIKEFQKKDKRVKYLFEPKRGAAAARHNGEINSQGEIILMTDSDCVVKKNWAAEMIEPIVKHGAVAVQGFKKAARENYWTRYMEKEETRCVRERIKDKKIGLLDTANFAIKKSVLEEIGFTNPRASIVNDTELEVRFKIKGYEIYFKEFWVLHYHMDNALRVFKKFFIRGFWNARLRKSYPSQKEFFFIPGKMNQFRYFASIIVKLLIWHRSFRYDFITGLAWRIGIFCGFIFFKDIT